MSQEAIDKEIKQLRLEHSVMTYQAQLLDIKRRKTEVKKTVLTLESQESEYHDKIKQAQEELELLAMEG